MVEIIDDRPMMVIDGVTVDGVDCPRVSARRCWWRWDRGRGGDVSSRCGAGNRSSRVTIVTRARSMTALTRSAVGSDAVVSHFMIAGGGGGGALQARTMSMSAIVSVQVTVSVWSSRVSSSHYHHRASVVQCSAVQCSVHCMVRCWRGRHHARRASRDTRA